MNSAQKSRRREFIKQSVIVSTAAVAAPYFVPRHVLGFDGTTGANDKIRSASWASVFAVNN